MIEQSDPSAIPLLKGLALDRSNALGRVHALWTLDVMGGIAAADLVPALTDIDPCVREQAAWLTEGRVAGNPVAVERLLVLADDPDPMVRFQTAFSLGELTDPRVAAALAAISARDRSSPLVRAAVLSSLAGRLPTYFGALARVPGFFSSDEGRSWLEELAAAAGSGGRPDEVWVILGYLADPQVNLSSKSAAAGLDRGLRYAGGSLRDRLRGETTVSLSPVFVAAREQAMSETLAAGRRVEAIRVLGLGPVAEALADLPGPRVGPLVIGRWESLSPTVRREALEVLFARPERLNALLDAIEAKTLSANQLDPARRKQRLTQADAAIRARGTKLLGGDTAEDRGRVLAAWSPVLACTGNRD